MTRSVIAALVVVLVALSTLAHATWKPEYGQSPPEEMLWFDSAMTTPAAAKRLGYMKCCDNSDRFKIKFLSGAKADEWYFERNGKWERIPDDVIHTEDDPTMPKQLKTEGVLFIYPPDTGQPTCFWPPESGQ
jgi:hypothetical protein